MWNSYYFYLILNQLYFTLELKTRRALRSHITRVVIRLKNWNPQTKSLKRCSRFQFDKYPESTLNNYA